MSCTKDLKEALFPEASMKLIPTRDIFSGALYLFERHTMVTQLQEFLNKGLFLSWQQKQVLTLPVAKRFRCQQTQHSDILLLRHPSLQLRGSYFMNVQWLCDMKAITFPRCSSLIDFQYPDLCCRHLFCHVASQLDQLQAESVLYLDFPLTQGRESTSATHLWFPTSTCDVVLQQQRKMRLLLVP